MTGLLDVALDYIRRGWAPVPIPHKAKRPKGDAWQTLRLAETTAAQFFNGKDQNIGVLLGEVSGGLTDVYGRGRSRGALFPASDIMLWASFQAAQPLALSIRSLANRVGTSKNRRFPPRCKSDLRFSCSERGELAWDSLVFSI